MTAILTLSRPTAAVLAVMAAILTLPRPTAAVLADSSSTSKQVVRKEYPEIGRNELLRLSGILDLSHDDQASVLGRENYDYLKAKYTERYGVKILMANPFGWPDVVARIKSSSMAQGRKHLDLLCSREAIPIHTIDCLNSTILSLPPSRIANMCSIQQQDSLKLITHIKFGYLSS
ncbi:hypothetical protein MBANPS3_006434 [Mucor bainieri]